MRGKTPFLAAFEGWATHRPPAWEQAFSSDVASAILGREACTGSTVLHYQEAVAGSQGEAAYQEFVERVGENVIALARSLNWSAVSPPWLRGRPSRRLDEHTFAYGQGDELVIYRYDPDTCTYGPVAYAQPPRWRERGALEAKVRKAWEAAERWPQEGQAEYEATLRRWLALAGEEFALVIGSAGLSVPLNEEWMIACALEPRLVGEYLDAQVSVGLRQLDLLAASGERYASGGGDLASKNGPLYGPRFFAQVVLPRYKQLIDHARRKGIYYIFRSDGDLWPIADMIFGEAAAPAFNEIDYDSGMEIPALQERFPQLTCIGNVPCGLLRTGTAEEVRLFVRALKEKALPRGRWVVASANTVLPGTPPENVFAMLEEASVL